MVVHDPRLNNPNTTPPTPLRPPGGLNTWTVDLSHSVPHILGWCARAMGSGDKWDALHLMAHGAPGAMQIGSGWINNSALPLFEAMAGRVRFIVFFSCTVGGDNKGWYWGHPAYFGQSVAQRSKARVVVCRQNQIYSWGASNTIDFGNFEGEVDIFAPDDSSESFQSPNPFRTLPLLDLEKLIFGA